VQPYKRIAVAIDFSDADSKGIFNAIKQGGNEAEYVLIHVVESAGAWLYGQDITDFETREDLKSLDEYVNQLRERGFKCDKAIGFGNPKKAIPKLVASSQVDLLVLGAHGHGGLGDLLFGTTVDAVRHAVSIPVLIVKN
jgi:manganese transport protein